MKTIRGAWTSLLPLLCAVATPVSAQIVFNYDWNNPSGGAYNQAINWTSALGGVPDTTSKVARFSLDAGYTVTIDSDYQVGGLTARDAGIVNLTFTTSIFTPRKIYRTEFLTVNPTAARTTTLRMIDGDIRISGNMTVGGNTSSGQANLGILSTFTSGPTDVGKGASVVGQVTVDPKATWAASGLLLLGEQGDAQLTLEASFDRNCFITCGPYFPTQAVASHDGVTMAGESNSSSTAAIRGIWTTGDLVVGSRGTAVVDVQHFSGITPAFTLVASAGRVMSDNAIVGAEPGSSGTVNVTGLAVPGFPSVASRWDLSGSLVLGGRESSQGGSGRLAIGNANTVSVGETYQMWSSGTLAQAAGGILTVSGVAMLDGALEFTATNPQLNDSFEILTATGGVTGTFDSLMFPTLGSGLAWDIDYNANNVVLTVVGDSLPGDYNDNGVVDAADYVLWRNGGPLANEVDAPGTTNAADYTAWRARFGNTSGSGAGGTGEPPVPTAVPEPSATMLILVGLALLTTRRG